MTPLRRYNMYQIFASKNINNIYKLSSRFSEVDDELHYPDEIDLKDLAEVRITSLKKAPLQSMKIGLPAAKAAVHFFHKLLFPQSIQLFSTDSINIKKNSINELKIIQHPVNCFSITDLTHHSIFHSKYNILFTDIKNFLDYKRDDIDVKQILLNLEKKPFAQTW